jgi:hypothetical protein
MKDTNHTNEQIKQVTNALLRDAEEAYRDGDEVAFFKSLERMKVGAEALVLLAQVADYTKEADDV